MSTIEDRNHGGWDVKLGNKTITVQSRTEAILLADLPALVDAFRNGKGNVGRARRILAVCVAYRLNSFGIRYLRSKISKLPKRQSTSQKAPH